MPERNDPRIEPGVSAAILVEQGGHSVGDDVDLPDYVMLDFVDDFAAARHQILPDTELS